MNTPDDIACPIVFMALALLALASAVIIAIGIAAALMRPEQMIGG